MARDVCKPPTSPVYFFSHACDSVQHAEKAFDVQQHAAHGLSETGEAMLWVRLCEATVRAEFPDFEVFNSMLVFNLAENESRRGAATSEVLVGLRRIALALDVDPHSLRQEWEALRPVAMAQKKMSQLDNRQAWKQAYDHVQKSSHMKNKYHLKALPVALRAYVCWTPSTFLGLI